MSRSEVHEALKSLDPHKVVDSDGVPNDFLRNFADQLTDPLHLIFNKSLVDGIFPSQWKD